MGGIMTVVERVLEIGFLAEGLSDAILKEKIRELLNEHKDEFNLMTQLHEFVEKLMNQSNLKSQLKTSVLLVADSWNTIFDDLQDKNELITKLLESFPDVKSENLFQVLKSGGKFGVKLIVFGYHCYTLMSGQKIEFTKDIAAFKDFFKRSSTKIKQTAPEITGSKISEEGTIQKQSFGKNAQNIPDRTRESLVEQAQQNEQKGGKGKGATAMRGILLAIDILNFVKGLLQLVELRQKLLKYKEYFKDDGEFQAAKQDLIELLSYVASDIFNLVQTSRAALFSCKNMFLTRTVLLSRNLESVLSYAQRIDPESLSITDSLIEASEKLLDRCTATKQSQSCTKQKLEQLQCAFSIYFTQQKPQQIFLKVATELSNTIGQYQLVSSEIDLGQESINRFFSCVSRFFQENRTADFQARAAEEKKLIDLQILNDTVAKYGQIFQIEDLTLGNMDQKTKDMVFRTIVSFTDKFYADDISGGSFLNLKICQWKCQKNYKQLLTSEPDKTTTMPISKQSDEDQAKDKWLKLAEDLNQKQGHAFWKGTDHVEGLYRYVRLQPEKSENGKYDVLTSYEGMYLQANGDKYAIEKNTLKNTLTLSQVPA